MTYSPAATTNSCIFIHCSISEKEKGSCARLKDELVELRHRDLKSYEEILAMKQAVTELTAKVSNISVCSYLLHKLHSSSIQASMHNHTILWFTVKIGAYSRSHQLIHCLLAQFAQIQALAEEASSLAEQALGEPAGAPHKPLSSRRVNKDAGKSHLLSQSPESPARVTHHHPPEQYPTYKQAVTPQLPAAGSMGRQMKQLRQQKSQMKLNSFQWPVRRLSDLQWPIRRRSGPEPANYCKTPSDLPNSGTEPSAYPYDFGSCSPLVPSTIDSSESATAADSYCEPSPDLPLGSDHNMESILRDIEEQLETTTLTGIIDKIAYCGLVMCICSGVDICALCRYGS